MGFFDHTREQEVAYQASLQSNASNPLDTLLLIQFIIGTSIAIAWFTILGARKYNKKHKDEFTLLEGKVSWRVAKVIYWSLAAVLLIGLVGFMNVWIIPSILLVYPLYLVIRGSFVYMLGVRVRESSH